VIGYVVMPEHFHLLISEPQGGNPSVLMQALKLGFARRVIAGLARAQVSKGARPGAPAPGRRKSFNPRERLPRVLQIPAQAEGVRRLVILTLTEVWRAAEIKSEDLVV